MEYFAAIKKNVLSHFQTLRGKKQIVEQYAQNGPICVNKKIYMLMYA